MYNMVSDFGEVEPWGGRTLKTGVVRMRTNDYFSVEFDLGGKNLSKLTVSLPNDYTTPLVYLMVLPGQEATPEYGELENKHQAREWLTRLTYMVYDVDNTNDFFTDLGYLIELWERMCMHTYETEFEVGCSTYEMEGKAARNLDLLLYARSNSNDPQPSCTIQESQMLFAGVLCPFTLVRVEGRHWGYLNISGASSGSKLDDITVTPEEERICAAMDGIVIYGVTPTQEPKRPVVGLRERMGSQAYMVRAGHQSAALAHFQFCAVTEEALAHGLTPDEELLVTESAKGLCRLMWGALVHY